jgi:hypothetical protein
MLEWRVPVNHLVQDASQGPYVARTADFEAAHAVGKLDRLWAHIIHRTNLKEASVKETLSRKAIPNLMVPLNIRGVIRNSIRNPEVDQL